MKGCLGILVFAFLVYPLMLVYLFINRRWLETKINAKSKGV